MEAAEEYTTVCAGNDEHGSVSSFVSTPIANTSLFPENKLARKLITLLGSWHFATIYQLLG
jgi:hypothetical protein